MNDFINEIKNIYFEKYNFDNNLNMLHELLNTDLISDTDKEFYKTMPIFGKTDRKSIFVKDFITSFLLNVSVPIGSAFW